VNCGVLSHLKFEQCQLGNKTYRYPVGWKVTGNGLPPNASFCLYEGEADGEILHAFARI
jgi:hypothetical protein